jgi:hypothetical protein
LECATALLDHAADPNIEDIEGRTLAEWREKETVKEASQKPESGRGRGNTDRKEIKGKEKGFTPLHNAVAYGYVSFIYVLLAFYFCCFYFYFIFIWCNVWGPTIL